jgi:hypothetical protein
MYFKENWQSMAEKEPPFGHVDIFQTSPRYEKRSAGTAERFAFYFAPSLKEAHSVPSHLVGEQSQQPTLMEFREQQFWAWSL